MTHNKIIKIQFENDYYSNCTHKFMFKSRKKYKLRLNSWAGKENNNEIQHGHRLRARIAGRYDLWQRCCFWVRLASLSSSDICHRLWDCRNPDYDCHFSLVASQITCVQPQMNPAGLAKPGQFSSLRTSKNGPPKSFTSLESTRFLV